MAYTSENIIHTILKSSELTFYAQLFTKRPLPYGRKMTPLCREAEVEKAKPLLALRNLPPIRIPRLMPSSAIGNVLIATQAQTINQLNLVKTFLV